MRRLFYVTLFGILRLCSCKDIRQANDSNFRNAIDQYLQNHGRICIWLARTLPIDVSEAQQKLHYGIGTQMTALQQAGLLRSVNTVADIPGLFGGSTRQHVLRYEPTQAGKTYLQQAHGVLSETSGFCYGTKTVASIVSWTDPAGSGLTTQTEITYRYKIDDLAA